MSPSHASAYDDNQAETEAIAAAGGVQPPAGLATG